MSCPNSVVESACPFGMKRARSLVACPLEKASSKALVIKEAASFHPKYSNIMTEESKSEHGFTTFLPAIFGAVPCVASKMACPVW